MTSLATTIRCSLLAAALAVAGSSIATAKGGNPVVRSNASCSSGVTAKLKAKHDDSRLEVEWEIDQNRNGVRWTWSIARDGVKVRSGVARTVAPSGSFSIERKIADTAGLNRIVARATRSGGKTCVARLSV